MSDTEVEVVIIVVSSFDQIVGFSTWETKGTFYLLAGLCIVDSTHESSTKSELKLASERCIATFKFRASRLLNVIGLFEGFHVSQYNACNCPEMSIDEPLTDIF